MSDLLRYKGILIATAILLLVVFLAAFANKALLNNSMQSSLTLQKVESLDSAFSKQGSTPSSDEFAAWEESMDMAQRNWLEKTAASELSLVRDAVVVDDAKKFKTAMLGLNKVVTAEADKRKRLLSLTPIVICVFGLLIYLLAIIPQLLRLTKNTEVQVESNQQAENILSTVSEGLFLLDKSGQIGIEQSASLKQMFRMERDLDGSFLDFIGQYVPDSSVSVAKDYLDLLYGDRVKEKLVKDLNPLNRVEISITRRDGTIESRFLDFKFARVMVKGELQHLLGSVTDVTREVMLEQALQDNKEEQEAQLELLMNILHLDKKSLSRFYSETDEALESINATLQERGSTSDQIRLKLNTIAEQAHRIKGDAAALKLHNFEFIMHEFETELDAVKNTKGSIGGRDVIPAVTKLKEVFSELNNMQSIVTRFSEVLTMERGQSADKSADESADGENIEAGMNENSLFDISSVKSKSQPVGSVLERELHDLVASVSERNDVRAVLKTFGLSDGEVPEELAKVVRETAIQLIRNSIAHGTLQPAERVAQGKPDYITITASLTKTERGHIFIVRDDGEGLDQEGITLKAVEKGLIKEEQKDSINSKLLARLIFHPGFSTRDNADLDAGRGVGLSAVHTMIRDAGGVLGFSQAAGKHCQFSARFDH